jgi:putative transposase
MLILSTQSNGMSKSFVKTFKRDCALSLFYQTLTRSFAKLPLWIEDYYEVHRHSALKLQLWRELIRLRA